MGRIGKLELYCERIEAGLTFLSAPPVFGTPFGVIQSTLGLIQLISAIVLHILSSFPCIYERWPNLEMRSLEHIVHGAANVAMGILKAIPFLGLIIFIQRKKRIPDLKEGHTPYVEFHYSLRAKRTEEDGSPLKNILSRQSDSDDERGDSKARISHLLMSSESPGELSE
jgi:hypothetical protein